MICELLRIEIDIFTAALLSALASGTEDYIIIALQLSSPSVSYTAMFSWSCHEDLERLQTVRVAVSEAHNKFIFRTLLSHFTYSSYGVEYVNLHLPVDSKKLCKLLASTIAVNDLETI